jgi:hypothetical protein
VFANVFALEWSTVDENPDIRFTEADGIAGMRTSIM